MKDTNGKIITEEEFMKGIGHGVQPEEIEMNAQENLTLEELLDEYGRLYYCYTDDIGRDVYYQRAVKRMQEILSLISSREEKAREEGISEGLNKKIEYDKEGWDDELEKAREEGRKEGYKQGKADEEINQLERDVNEEIPIVLHIIF